MVGMKGLHAAKKKKALSFGVELASDLYGNSGNRFYHH
jgi:hypothetical protein